MKNNSISGGTTRRLSIAEIPQYNKEISTSSGAVHNARVFFMKKSVGERVISARRAQMKVRVAPVSPRIVKYCQCHYTRQRLRTAMLI